MKSELPGSVGGVEMFARVVSVFLVGFSVHLLASEGLARVEERARTKDVLRDYGSYLHFVLDVGKTVDSTTAQRLARRYDALSKRSPELAARFLTGLRFEMEHKRDLGLPSGQHLSRNSKETRRWVKKFIPYWYREADDLLLRSVVLAKKA